MHWLTWRNPGGDGGGGELALALGGHAGHLDGVGGEGSQAGDAVFLGLVGQVVGDASVGAVELLPGDAVACRGMERNIISSQRKRFLTLQPKGYENR